MVVSVLLGGQGVVFPWSLMGARLILTMLCSAESSFCYRIPRGVASPCSVAGFSCIKWGYLSHQLECEVFHWVGVWTHSNHSLSKWQACRPCLEWHKRSRVTETAHTQQCCLSFLCAILDTLVQTMVADRPKMVSLRPSSQVRASSITSLQFGPPPDQCQGVCHLGPFHPHQRKMTSSAW